MAKQLISLPPQFRKPHSHSFLHPPAVWNQDQFLPGTMRKSSNSPLAAISLPSISHRRSGTAHRKSVQHERHELPWPDPIDQNADAHRHENDQRSEEHTSELQSLMRISSAVFCLKKKKTHNNTQKQHT